MGCNGRGARADLDLVRFGGADADHQSDGHRCHEQAKEVMNPSCPQKTVSPSRSWVLPCLPVLSGCSGCHNGYGEKLSYSQAQSGRHIS